MGEVVKIYQENIVQKRKFKIMSNGAVQTPAGNGNSSNNSRGFLGTLKEYWVIIAAVITGVTYVVSSITGIQKDIEKHDESIGEIKKNYVELNGTIEHLSSIVDDDHEIFLELASSIKDEPAYKLALRDDYEVKTVKVENEEYLAEPLWTNDSVIGSDIGGDIVYKAEDLYNTLILTSYKDVENEVYFLGRFNENNHWNGRCIMNVYNGDNLVSIFEGMYDDGELFSYKRVTEENGDTWVINDRVKEKEYNRGETWKYEKKKEFVKDFTLENVKDKQVMTVDSFLTSIDYRLRSYYNGRTFDGKYKDETGNAYLVKYKEDGNVDILYKGKFINGKFHDQDKDAKSWFISWGNDDDGYYYYIGKFTNGDHGKEPTPWKPLEQEEIDEIVNPNEYKCLLPGLIKGNL